MGVFSVCSANKFVIEACMRQAAEDGCLVCIESTSNQVNQFGGYTGMAPQEFVDNVQDIAKNICYPKESLVLGGDHIGPNPWRKEPSKFALKQANDLVFEYAKVGFRKIHLDASMRCADDPEETRGGLDDDIIALRTAELCQSAESGFAQSDSDLVPPLYIIGTEVPTPGGWQVETDEIHLTQIAEASNTLEIIRQAFYSKGLQDAWNRVIGLVVQPGVEFGDDCVIDYESCRAHPLSNFIESIDNIVFEAHSTDYQKPAALKQLVEDHFAILKVGPWLTYVLRESLFALESIELEFLQGRRGITLSSLRKNLDAAMISDPQHWEDYYRGDAYTIKLKRKYSFSDRCRYYWSKPEVQKSVERLLGNLLLFECPLTLLSQYLPREYYAIRDGSLMNKPLEIIDHKIREVASFYTSACGSL